MFDHDRETKMKHALAAIAAALILVSAPSIGDTSKENIRAVQTMLTQCGFNPGPTDGIWGKKTGTAAASYVRAHGGDPESGNRSLLLDQVDFYRTGDAGPCPGVSSGPVDLEPICPANRADGPDGCWIEVSNIPGCHGWNAYPSTNNTYTWTGICKNGLTSGSGTGTWRYQNDQGEWEEYSSEGGYVDGKEHGYWVEKDADGTVFEGPYVNGKRHGHWVWKFSFGTVAEGPYVDGKLHGHWVWKDTDGTVFELLYVDGELQ